MDSSYRSYGSTVSTFYPRRVHFPPTRVELMESYANKNILLEEQIHMTNQRMKNNLKHHLI